jgi:hypothetical protein
LGTKLPPWHPRLSRRLLNLRQRLALRPQLISSNLRQRLALRPQLISSNLRQRLVLRRQLISSNLRLALRPQLISSNLRQLNQAMDRNQRLLLRQDNLQPILSNLLQRGHPPHTHNNQRIIRLRPPLRLVHSHQPRGFNESSEMPKLSFIASAKLGGSE